MSKDTEKEKPKPLEDEMAEKELADVSGGCIPTPVNGQITDAIT